MIPKLPQTYVCPISKCEASFSKASKLIIHNRIHTGERPFPCDECSKAYISSSHLRRHQKIIHINCQRIPVLCPYEGCVMSLSNSTNLKKHIARNHTNAPFPCKYCAQFFKRKLQLRVHMYTHTGKPPFHCSSCNQSYTNITQFKKHQKSHKTYLCDCCNKEFPKWTLFRAHKRTCSNKVLKCEKCSKIFKHHGNLKIHCNKVHTESKEVTVISCPYENCDRQYLYKRNLTYHIQKSHNPSGESKIYNCTFDGCSMVLKSKQGLQRHLQIHNKNCVPTKRKKRCDANTIKTNMALFLTGLDQQIEKNLL